MVDSKSTSTCQQYVLTTTQLKKVRDDYDNDDEHDMMTTSMIMKTSFHSSIIKR